MVVEQRKLGGRWSIQLSARKAEMAEHCFCITAVSSALVRTGIQHFLLPGWVMSGDKSVEHTSVIIT